MCNGLRVFVALVLSLSAAANAQTTSQPAFPYEGEIVGDDVYVRSGPGSNFYPTTKLHAGDRVQVLDEKYSWVKVAPVEGSFSYIDMTMVDKSGPDSATVKADRVNVYAGSTLTNKKREIQVQLDKGATVKPIGDVDGFYKIAPPPGAALYISAQYVRRATGPARPARRQPTEPPPTALSSPPKSALDSEPAAQASTPPVKASPTERTTRDRDMIDSHGNRVNVQTTPPSAANRLTPVLRGGGAYSERLTALESRLRETLRKTELKKDDLTGLQHDYEEIAAQDAEPVAQAIARTRATQLRDRIALLDARDAILADHADLKIFQRQLGEDRATMDARLRTYQAQRDFDFKGQLRSTLIFPPETHTYRLVDMQGKASIVAYVQVSPEMEQNIGAMLGQYVGVRVEKRKVSPTGVPLVVASDVVVMSPDGVAATQPAADPAVTAKPGDDSGSEPETPDQP